MDRTDILSLKGKVSLITGGSSGIGLAIAETYIKHGSDVVIVARNKERGEKISKSLNGSQARCTFFKCDTANHDEVKNTCQKVLDKFGKVDILVLNAGTEFTEPINEIKIDHWQKVMDVNLSGPFYFIRYLIDPMLNQKKGNIIVTSSVATLTGAGGGMHYSASKAGLKGIVSRINYELLSKGIRANLISPGVIDTPMLRKKYPDTPKVNKLLESQIPYGRIGKPQDVANLALFLASDLSDYICGQDISIDGGRTFHRRPKGSLVSSTYDKEKD
ncbi:MAG: SDR family NAD(P)-dependent oxidoreductase [Actinomycetota bacterium]